MARSALSPHKYIETKARALPIYKCYVNRQWKEAHEADVIVMRKHVNGNITAGIYLVDLMCLGIKDTFFFFNEPEDEIEERFPGGIHDMFEEAEYALAHNIIYAGHDFALDFDIAPHKDFAVTKFILEEDNDSVPLMEIPVGDEDGLPHLMVHQPGEYSSALAKLQKNAGEGNYKYTVSGITKDNEEEEDLDDEGDMLEDYDLGQITPLAVQYISDNELYDIDKTDQRVATERITILTERALRNLRIDKPDLFKQEVEETEDYKLIEQSTATACGVSEEEEENFKYIMQSAFASEDDKEEWNKDLQEDRTVILRDLLHKHADKLLVVAAIFESEMSSKGELFNLAQSGLEDLQAYPLATLDLALANLLQPEPGDAFEAIYNTADITALFPEAGNLGDKELGTFWLIQTVLHLNRGNLEQAIHYYYLYSEIDTINFMVTLVQVSLFDAISNVLTEGNEDNQ